MQVAFCYVCFWLGHSCVASFHVRMSGHNCAASFADKTTIQGHMCRTTCEKLNILFFCNYTPQELGSKQEQKKDDWTDHLGKQNNATASRRLSEQYRLQLPLCTTSSASAMSSHTRTKSSCLRRDPPCIGPAALIIITEKEFATRKSC